MAEDQQISSTLGEKLRHAREDRGLSLSEVAEQTRISSLYLEAIENDDYRILPGGIFNKGFVKSYAKFVGVSEQEALADYARIVSSSDMRPEPEQKLYRPEVLTDERSMSRMMPTMIVAAVILALMTFAILYGLSYWNAPSEPTVAVGNSKANANSAPETTETNTAQSSGDVPDMATLKVEFKTSSQPVQLIASSDGAKADKFVTVQAPAIFEPKESLSVSYNKWNADKIQMSINGKQITLPAVPLKPTDKRIEFVISRDNLAQIWATGAISTDVPAVPVSDTNTNAAPVVNTAPVATAPPPRTPQPKPSVPANTAPAKTPAPKLPVNAAKPPTNAR